MYTLYHYPFSQHARRVVMLLEEARLPYALRHVAMDRGEHASPEFARVNPNGQVPALVDEDLTLTESNAILRYVCVKHSLTGWYPAAARERAQVDQWLDWNQCQLSPAVVDVVLNEVFLGEAGDVAAAARGRERLPKLAAILEARLGETAYMVGERPTIADLSIASNISHLALADAMPKTARLVGWFERVAELDGFQKAVPDA